jgi:hypothetical protein
MNKKARFYLSVFCAITLFDVVASCASKLMMFDYTNLVPLSWLLYFAAGYFGCKYHGFLGGVLAGLVAGVADSTAGWVASSAIGPYVPVVRSQHTFLAVAFVVAVVSITGIIFGSIGAALRMLIGRWLTDA